MTSNGSALAGQRDTTAPGTSVPVPRLSVEAATTSPKGATAPWVARLAVVLALGSFVLWLLFTWNLVPGLKVIGAWNYLISMVLVLGAAVVMRFWRGA
jgi:hypothetical protein